MATLIGNCRESCPTCPSIGTFNRLNYDNCAYDKKLSESTSPLTYQMARYKFENCARCTYNGKQYAPFDLVEEESELRGMSRLASRCPTKKYNPTCQKSETCLSTHDKSIPVVYPPNLCPVVCNNIKKMNNPGYTVPKRDFCDKSFQQNQQNQNQQNQNHQNQQNQQYQQNQQNQQYQQYQPQAYQAQGQQTYQPQYNTSETRYDNNLLKQVQMMQRGQF